MKNKYRSISIIILCTAISILASCNKTKNVLTYNSITKTTIKDTINNLAEINSDSAIWNDNGIYRTVTIEKSNDVADENRNEENVTNAATCATDFEGVDRAIAKTSFATATTYTYSTFSTFRNTLQTDAFMRGLNIPRNSNSNRVSQENRNAKFNAVYLYALKKEADRDFHLILGDANLVSLLNCEASGFPATTGTAYTAIKAVKDAITARFGSNLCSQSSYLKFNPAVPITSMKGSLFFDVDHAAGTVGPAGFRPTTAWEIHPINAIQF
jgi:hypothetical protein